MLRPGTFALTTLLAALSAIGPLTTDMYLPSLPDIARQLNASTAQAQFTISAYLIGFAIGQIFYGPVSDRHGRKPILIAAIALYCIASLACSLSTSIEMLIVARSRHSAAAAASYWPVRSCATSIPALGRGVTHRLGNGACAGPGTDCGWIPADLVRLRAAFFTLVAAGVIGVGIVWAALPETLKLRATEPLSIPSILRSYRLVARNPRIFAYLGITAASYAGLFVWICRNSDQRRPKRLFSSQPSSPPLAVVVELLAATGWTGAGGTGLELPSNRPEKKLPVGAPGRLATGTP
jgi:MFS transporter, DHA1 family, multidrug resistance protein